MKKTGMINRAERRRMASQKTPSGRKLTRFEKKRYCEYLKITRGFVEPRRADRKDDSK